MATLRAPDVSEIDDVRALLCSARQLVILTGAGISAESGVPTFRGPDGLWRKYRPEELATPEAFRRDPVLVWEWYAWRREIIARLEPNAAHVAIARASCSRAGLRLVTQNVDGLHARAGSTEIIELHGNLWRMRCLSCGEISEDRRVPLPTLPPSCQCGGTLRPDVVWFGEALPSEALQSAADAAQNAEVALVVGTSSLVYPAAALPQIAHQAGAAVIEINPEPTPLTPLSRWSLRGTAVTWVPRLLQEAPRSDQVARP